MDRPALADRLVEAFDADPETARAVARAAGDLRDDGRYRDDVGSALEPTVIVSELRDAPGGSDLAERWNWWIGSLDVAFGGYGQFFVRR